MRTLTIIVSIIGIINSFILIIYALTTKKGKKEANFYFALLILTISLRVSHSVFVTFYPNLNAFFLILGLAGFLSIGPAYYFFVESVLDKNFVKHKRQVIHFVPALVLLFCFPIINVFYENEILWQIFNRTVLLQYIIYLAISVYKLTNTAYNSFNYIKQLKVSSILMLSIWVIYLINDVSGIPYISGAILYSILIYVTLIIIFNKGYIINFSGLKYEKSGLDKLEEERILKELNSLLIEDKYFTNNTLSLSVLAKKINTNNHALSQVINKNKQKTFFELIRTFRIEESKKMMKEKKKMSISDIAYSVGYNSISSFNKAFKLETKGKTPSQYKNEN